MKRSAGNLATPTDRWRPGWLPAVAAGLVLAEHALVDEVGSPMTLLRALRDLGDAWADPVVPVLSLLALLAETLIGYVLGVLALRSLSLLPGAVGRIAGRVALLVTPVAVRRLLDLVVGGTLLAQATLGATSVTPPGPGPGVPHLAMATTSTSGGLLGPATASDLVPASVAAVRRHRPVQVLEPVKTRPTPRRSAVPLPPWLGGGPSKPAPGHSGKSPVGYPDAPPPGRGGKPPVESPDVPPPGHRGKPPAGHPSKTPPESSGTAPPGDAATVPPGYTVEPGDTLWDIAAAHLPTTERSAANVHRYWQQVYRANRPVIGGDPDMIHPGTRLAIPPFRRDR